MKNVKNYQPKTYKSIPLAFDQSLSYYECICNITNYINNEIIPAVEETNETVIILSNKFDDLKKYVDDNMLTKDIDNLTYYTKTSDLSEVALTGNYNDLSNKPTIPTKTSDLDNDSGYITNTDYATGDTGGVIKLDQNYSTYLSSGNALRSTTKTYNEYNNSSQYTFISKGTLENVITGKGLIDKNVNDLTNYTLTSSLSTVATSGSYNDLSNKPTIPDVSNFITKDVNDLTYYTLTSSLSSVATSGSYNDLSNTPTIPTKTSELTNDSNYVTNTDYASSSTGGVIKLDQNYSTYLSSGNALRSTTKTYTEYNNASQYTFISKGTLENVITGKGLVSNDTALINASNKNISGITAWDTNTFQFASGDTFTTSNSNLFEFDTTGIKCKFTGTVLIIRAMTLDGSCNNIEIDLIDELGVYNLVKGINKNSFSMKNVSTNDVISLQYISEITSFTAYNTRIIVVRLK